MKKNRWLLPALACALFLAYSLWAAVTAGPLGFLEHARDRWGVQVFIDLASACSLTHFFAAAKAKKYGVRPLPWIVLTMFIGSIALFAYAARIAYAREKERERGAG